MTDVLLDDAFLAAFATVVEELPEAVLLTDRRRTLVRNAAARALPPDLLGHRCPDQRRGHDLSCPACQRDAVLGGAGTVRWHLVAGEEMERSDIHEITLSPVRNGRGEVVAVLETVRDATVVLRLENHLIRLAEERETALGETTETARRHHERAEELRRELGAVRDSQTEMLARDRLDALTVLVASLAHEINTPLGALLSGAEFLERTLEQLRAEVLQEEAPGVRRRLDVLAATARLQCDAARRIESVLRTLRLFSRLDEARQEPYDLHQGLEAVLALLGHRVTDRIRIVREYGEIPRVICRPDACNQVFMNLLLNAVQAIEETGEIRVSTRRVGDEVVVEVHDTGRGVPEDELPRIFDLGFTTRAGRGGSGIGLALVRRIVREHHGTIEVSSRPGRGTRFRVCLPVTPPSERT